MKKFYRRIDIPNLSKIQEELIGTIGHDFINAGKTHSWIGRPAEILHKCPTLNEFFKTRLRRPLEQIKFYCTPPWQILDAHVDGSKDLKIPFGLNIPLLNTENTCHYWYYCPPENTMSRSVVDNKKLYTTGYLSEVDVPINTSIMPVIETLELTTPCVTKTDVMHSVANPTGKTRLIAVFRWGLSIMDYKELEDVLDTNGLVVDESRDFSYN